MKKDINFFYKSKEDKEKGQQEEDKETRKFMLEIALYIHYECRPAHHPIDLDYVKRIEKEIKKLS